MPPKYKFTKEQIIDCAVNIVRSHGISALTARALAEALDTSVKPIFVQFDHMDAVRDAVHSAADARYRAYLEAAMERRVYPPYKASGIAYIRFAKEETELFKLLFMRNRSGEPIPENREDIRPILNMLKKDLNLCEEETFLFHMELWVYVHGIATMIATGFLDWDMTFIEQTLSDVYGGLTKQFAERHIRHD